MSSTIALASCCRSLQNHSKPCIICGSISSSFFLHSRFRYAFVLSVEAIIMTARQRSRNLKFIVFSRLNYLAQDFSLSFYGAFNFETKKRLMSPYEKKKKYAKATCWKKRLFAFPNSTCNWKISPGEWQSLAGTAYRPGVILSLNHQATVSSWIVATKSYKYRFNEQLRQLRAPLKLIEGYPWPPFNAEGWEWVPNFFLWVDH